MEWVSKLADLSNRPPQHIAAWLVNAKRLSPHLKICYQRVNLNCLEEGWLNPTAEEADCLPGQQGLAWIRTIVILGNNQPCTFGRAVIPYETYERYRDVFENLGSALLGENFLYQNASFKRSAFEYAVCDATDPFCKQFSTLHTMQPMPKSIWLRRSKFDCDSYPLLLTEVLLPTLCDFPEPV